MWSITSTEHIAVVPKTRSKVVAVEMAVAGETRRTTGGPRLCVITVESWDMSLVHIMMDTTTEKTTQQTQLGEQRLFTPSVQTEQTAQLYLGKQTGGQVVWIMRKVGKPLPLPV